MGDKIGFTLRLTSDDWDSGLNAWRCPALDIPSAFIEKARDGEGKSIELELLKIEKGPARVTWIGSGQPAQLSLAVGLGEELSPTSYEQFWKRFAVVVPIVTAIVGAGATYLSKAQSNSPKYTLSMSVYPNELQNSGWPPARIKLNNRDASQPVVDYPIVSNVDAVVDVNEAVEAARKLGSAYTDQKNAAVKSVSGVNDVVTELNDLSVQLRGLSSEVAGPICSGGPHGEPAQAAGRLSSQATEVSTKLKSISAALSQTLSVNITLPQ